MPLCDALARYRYARHVALNPLQWKVRKIVKKIGLMLKTYSDDLDYCSRLIDSYNRYNSEGIDLVIVVPSADIQSFSKFQSSLISLVPDEEIPVDYVNPKELAPDLIGIANAGVSKLGFWELGFFENTFAIDSDMEFIRNFGPTDFINPKGHPYTVVSEGVTQKIDQFYFSRYWSNREKSLKLVSSQLGFPNPLGKAAFCSQVLNSDILRGLKTNFLEPRGIGYADLMRAANYEFFWYTIWAINQPEVPTEVREELVAIVHHQGQHLNMVEAGVSKAVLARAFIGVIVNSNWSRQYGIVDFDEPPRNQYYSSGSWASWNVSQ